MEKKKEKYKIRLYSILIILGLLTCFFTCSLSETESRTYPLIEEIALPEEPQEEVKHYTPFDGNYDKTFNDLHKLHTEEATKLGFATMATHQDTARLKGNIVYLKPGEYENFIIDSLPHSIPIMIPQVARLIEEIGTSFRDSLKAIGFVDCKMVVTSITRTEADIKKLRRQNGNAIHESTHRHGTSFDISWLQFHVVDTLDTRTPYQSVLKKNLGKVLNRMSQEQKCYIKYETQQMCFHITIREQ